MPHYQQRFTTKIENSFVVWFEESNNWILFEEPAYFIYILSSRATVKEDILKRFQRRYGIPEADAQVFINEILTNIDRLSVPPEDEKSRSGTGTDIQNLKFTANLIHCYKMNRKLIRLEFETALPAYYIHPLFAHLEFMPPGNADNVYEIFQADDRFVLREKGERGKFWTFHEITGLKKKLYVELSGLIHHVKEKSWLSFIHAAAVRDGRQTVLLSSSSGYGKSTLAALLMKEGLEFVSDDFVALSYHGIKAYPFPAALTLKTPSYSYFPAEELVDLSYRNLKNRSVKYLAPVIRDESWYKPHPVKKILFVRYDQESACEFSKLTAIEALKLFHEQAVVTPGRRNAAKFLKWFRNVECYQLVYSENRWAIDNILRLLNDPGTLRV